MQSRGNQGEQFNSAATSPSGGSPLIGGGASYTGHLPPRTSLSCAPQDAQQTPTLGVAGVGFDLQKGAGSCFSVALAPVFSKGRRTEINQCQELEPSSQSSGLQDKYWNVPRMLGYCSSGCGISAMTRADTLSSPNRSKQRYSQLMISPNQTFVECSKNFPRMV